MKFDLSVYEIKDTQEIISPALIYYEDIIRANVMKAIEMAGGAHRLCPHVKSHKMSAVVRMQLEMGITRFKCATIAEAQMLADSGARKIVLSYPLVGPNIARFAALAEKYRDCYFWAIGDDLEQISLLGKKFAASGSEARLLVDVNMGMNRTGVPLDELEEFCRKCVAIDGVSLEGLHCYDGHNTNSNRALRDGCAAHSHDRVMEIQAGLKAEDIPLDMIIMGGTPAFPCYTGYSDILMSPGTFFLGDYGYACAFRDMNFIPGVAVLSRVISHPAPGMFTIDAGSKGIAADPAGVRGVIVGYENDVRPILQSEEHWVFQMVDGSGRTRPPIGTVLYVIPTHVCPTSALYPAAVAVKGKEAGEFWEVTARNRKITV